MLTIALRLSDALHRAVVAGDIDEEKTAQIDLTKLLKMEQGVPCERMLPMSCNVPNIKTT